jgi:hypothetical protein
MKFTTTIIFVGFAGFIAANPAPIPHAKPIPQAPKSSGLDGLSGKGVGGACTSNAWEKIHEGHGHNINDGTVAGKPLGLKLPGSSGCYKGAKSPSVLAR